MLDNLIFYCHYGAGDIVESREFVKDWMELLEAKHCYYAHGKHPRILLDMEDLEYTPVTEQMDMRMPFIFDSGAQTLMVNTWIGRDSRYVLPGIGCVVEMFYKMHNDMRMMLSLPPLRRNVIDYLPEINYSKYDVNRAERFVNTYLHVKKVLICNGPVQSCQAENFDFNPVIERLADNYKDRLFILTQHMGTSPRSNILYTDEIIQSPSGFDLNEVSYLSTSCDVIVGRNSGPHVFSQVKRNWMDDTKKIISFTYKEIASTFVLHQPVKMKKYWSDRTDAEGVYNKIKGVLDE